MRRLAGWVRRWYGARPLHLLALLAAFALAGYAVRGVVAAGQWRGFALWFAVAIVGHDLLLFPLYSLADLSLRRLLPGQAGPPRRRRGRAAGPRGLQPRRPPALAPRTFLSPKRGSTTPTRPRQRLQPRRAQPGALRPGQRGPAPVQLWSSQLWSSPHRSSPHRSSPHRSCPHRPAHTGPAHTGSGRPAGHQLHTGARRLLLLLLLVWFPLILGLSVAHLPSGQRPGHEPLSGPVAGRYRSAVRRLGGELRGRAAPLPRPRSPGPPQPPYGHVTGPAEPRGRGRARLPTSAPPL